MNRQYKLKACAISNIGKFRVNHEDNFLLDNGIYIREFEQKEISSNPDLWKKSFKRIYPANVTSTGIFAVSDGMGGHNAGEIASRIAVEQLKDTRDYIFRTPDVNGVKERFQDYILKANTVITMRASQHQELKGMGATLTGLILCEEGIMPFNIGDSRTYIFDNGHLVKLTKDHTEGQRLIDLGMVKSGELHLIDGGKSITRFLGVDDKFMVPQADVGDIIRIDQKTWFLACSDGLTDMLPEREIQAYLSYFYANGNIDQAAFLLVAKALEDRGEQKGGIDNTTVLLVEVDKYLHTDAVKDGINKITGWFLK